MDLISEKHFIYEKHSFTQGDMFDFVRDLRALRAAFIASTPGTPIQNNLTATTDPTVNDDASAGYSTSSIWFNTSTQTFWACTNATIGGAVWSDQAVGGTSLLNNMTATVAPTVNDDSGDGYAVNSGWFNTVTGILYFCQSASAGAAVWLAVPPSSGTGVTDLTVSATRSLISGNGLTPNALYRITNADSGRASVIVRAKSNNTFFKKGNDAVFQNSRMSAPVLCDVEYSLTASVDKIFSVREPLYNNTVSCLDYFTALGEFQFDNAAWKNNSFKDVDATGWSGTGLVFDGVTLETIGVNLHAKNNIVIKNHWQKGALNIGAVDEIDIPNHNVAFECNNAWANDETGVFTGFGDGAFLTYVNMGWTSYINFHGFASTVRYATLGNEVEIDLRAIGGTAAIYHCQFDDGSICEIEGTLAETHVGGGSSTGRITGSNNTLMGVTTSGGTAVPVDINNSNLSNVVIQNRATGAAFYSANLTNCTVNFAGKTGCTVVGTITGGTITFTANNQTIYGGDISFSASETGPNPPTFDNGYTTNIPTTLSWTYQGAGIYRLVSSIPLFKSTNTILLSSYMGVLDPISGNWMNWTVQSPTELQIGTLAGAGYLDDQLALTAFKITILPIPV